MIYFCSSITPSKTFSHNVINFENKSEPPNERYVVLLFCIFIVFTNLVFFFRQISSFERFAKTLYNSTPPPNPKLAKRSKQKTRSKTVDPRFRR